MVNVNRARSASTEPYCLSLHDALPILRFIDYKGHSRFVLRILIILSHRSRKQGESLPPLWKLLTRRGRVVKALPYDKQREVLPPLPVKRGYLLSSLAQHNPTSETDETNSPGRGRT